MSDRMDLRRAEELLLRFRRRPLFDPATLPVRTDYGPEVVRLLLPHRAPLLLVDRVTGLDLAGRRIAGSRHLAADDPVFAGHFPGTPIYPGTLQVEMAGQLGLCLHGFVERESSDPPDAPVNLAVRATRILGALYGEALPPGADVTLLAEVIASDGYFASVIAQCLLGERVASVSAGEVLFL